FRRVRPRAVLGRYPGADKAPEADVRFASIQTLDWLLPPQGCCRRFTARESPPRPQGRPLAAQAVRTLPAASGGRQRPGRAFLGNLAGRAKAHPARRPLPTPRRLPKWQPL